MIDITTISSKGQVVIPSHIREELGLEEGSQVVVSTLENLVILKKIKISDPKEEFAKLTALGQKHAQKLGLKSEDDVVRIIHHARKARN